MTPIHCYALAPWDDGDDDGDARSVLLKDGVRTGLVLPGRCLEAQFHGLDGDLLFLTHDIPYEEQLEIVLIADSGAILDRASVSGAYTTGHFRDATVTGGNSVAFAFFDGPPWRLTTSDTDRFRLPWLGCEPRGVHRPFGWRRRFAIEPVVRRENSRRSRNGLSHSD